ncbi:MAG: hypothetical protein KIT84_21985 [Labilithrix sp.]|nr:hypothetical protein [Labilithrix sp.]MCW5813715.1 hypothetical protein [Labilithrix sp.]
MTTKSASKKKARAKAKATPVDEPAEKTTEPAATDEKPEKPAEEPAEEPAEKPAAKAPGFFDATRRHLILGFYAPLLLLFWEMWQVRRFTVDDSYISFRYARNFARGLGLVYNEGERVEGYTNFLWTVLLGIGIKVGLDPDFLVKVMGGTCAAITLFLLFRLSDRLRPYTAVPCVATWLFATSALNTGYSVFGLETPLFVTLVVGGMYLFFQEEPAFGEPAPRASKFPVSGILYGLAGITRPEAPMFIGILMLFLGRGLFSKRNITRGLLFVAPVGAHLLFRRSYYGQWTPNTFGAKTGNFDGQIQGGLRYVQNYIAHESRPLLIIAAIGVLWALLSRRRDLLSITATGAAVAGYVVLVGGDWMALFRFLVPFEPFCFLLICIVLREAWDRLNTWDKDRARLLRAIGLAVCVGISVYRVSELGKSQRFIMGHEDRFWRMAAGGTAKWLNEHPRGMIALGDIGYVGYATDYPLLDLLGLVDPVIAKLPGGYTQKIGPGFADRLFDVNPRYVLIISANRECNKPSVAGSRVIYYDHRFAQRYTKAGLVPLDDNFAWCLFENPTGR